MTTLLLVAVLLASQQDPDIGTSVYVGDEEVRDYRPEPGLEVRRTEVAAARFGAVDVHCHWNLREDPVAALSAIR